MMGRPVLVRRYTTDRYGNRTEASTHTVQRAAFAPRPVAGARGSSELTDRASTVVADAELYVPFGADIVPTDEIELEDGSRWEVSGAVEPWRSPFSGMWPAGAVVPLRRMTG